MTTYTVQVIHEDRHTDVAVLREAIACEVRRLGVHDSVSVEVSDAPPTAGMFAVAVVLGSAAVATSVACNTLVTEALASLRVVLPTVADLVDFTDSVPSEARPLNGVAWDPTSEPTSIVRRILEELGIEHSQRKVFISHRRSDAILMAEQLHDQLAHRGFSPFVDRFAIPAGVDFQRAIADALEDYAFVLFIESPDAHKSTWVFDEVMYAMTHSMGTHIVSWPGKLNPLPGTGRMPRQHLKDDDLKLDGGYKVLTDRALDAVVEEVEEAHASAMALRRRTLLQSVEEAAESAGRECIPLGGWLLRIGQPGAAFELVHVASRLPTVDDLYQTHLAMSQNDCAEGVIVHAARNLTGPRRELLTWAGGDRSLVVIPENAIGARWQL